MLDFNILTIDQLCGINRLYLFEGSSISCEITDFAVLLGGTSSLNVNNNLYGNYFALTSLNNSDTFRRVNTEDEVYNFDNSATIGVRPIVDSSTIDLDDIKGYSSIKVGQFGEYPQSIVNEDFSRDVLDKIVDNNDYKTGKKYHVGKKEFEEYIFCGVKYVSIKGDKSNVYHNY